MPVTASVSVSESDSSPLQSLLLQKNKTTKALMQFALHNSPRPLPSVVGGRTLRLMLKSLLCLMRGSCDIGIFRPPFFSCRASRCASTMRSSSSSQLSSLDVDSSSRPNFSCNRSFLCHASQVSTASEILQRSSRREGGSATSCHFHYTDYKLQTHTHKCNFNKGHWHPARYKATS